MKQNIIKVIMVLFLIGYLVVVYQRDNVKDIVMDDVITEMEKDTTLTSLKKGDVNALKRYYSLGEADCDGFLLYCSESPMAVEELLIIKAKNESQTEGLEKAAQSRLTSQKKSFEGYGAEQSALLDEAIVDTKGKFVIYAAGKDAEKWKEEFMACIK